MDGANKRDQQHPTEEQTEKTSQPRKKSRNAPNPALVQQALLQLKEGRSSPVRSTSELRPDDFIDIALITGHVSRSSYISQVDAAANSSRRSIPQRSVVGREDPGAPSTTTARDPIFGELEDLTGIDYSKFNLALRKDGVPGKESWFEDNEIDQPHEPHVVVKENPIKFDWPEDWFAHYFEEPKSKKWFEIFFEESFNWADPWFEKFYQNF